MKKLNEFMVTEAIPIPVDRAYVQLIAAQKKFMLKYKQFRKEVIGESGEYGDKLTAMDQKILKDTKALYADVQAKQKQFDQSVWAMHLR